MQFYRTPFSKAYWQGAAADFRRPRNLVFSALMAAVCIALSQIPSIPINDSLGVTWGFLGRATCAMVCGPVSALAFGFAEDTLSFLLHPTGPYFPGYTITTMLGTMIYALFLYRTKITVMRVFLAKLTTNAVNVFLGSLWSAILYRKGYLYYMASSAVKNTALLPVQTIMLVVLFAALLPILQKMKLLPTGTDGRLKLPWVKSN